jgi:hypothetical protein
LGFDNIRNCQWEQCTIDDDHESNENDDNDQRNVNKTVNEKLQTFVRGISERPWHSFG